MLLYTTTLARSDYLFQIYSWFLLVAHLVFSSGKKTVLGFFLFMFHFLDILFLGISFLNRIAPLFHVKRRYQI